MWPFINITKIVDDAMDRHEKHYDKLQAEDRRQADERRKLRDINIQAILDVLHGKDGGNGLQSRIVRMETRAESFPTYKQILFAILGATSGIGAVLITIYHLTIAQ